MVSEKREYCLWAPMLELENGRVLRLSGYRTMVEALEVADIHAEELRRQGVLVLGVGAWKL